MREFTVFWGCTIQARFPFIEKSVRTVLDALTLPYKDVDGFTCCPEKSLINNVDHGMWLLTAARNMAVAEAEKVDVVSPCTGCISNLATVKGELNSHPEEKGAVNSVLGAISRKYEGTASLKHLVPFFHDEVGILKIKSRMKRDFSGMRLAVHYGCHMMRPSHALKNDDPLNPKKFDALIRALGGESMEYMSKLMCCGQGLDRVDQHDTALQMARIKLGELKRMKADALVLCCPSCFLQFDNNQYLMEKEGEKFNIPVLYFTDLLGLALGFKPEDLGIDSHRVDVTGFLEKWDALEKSKTPRSAVNDELGADGALI